MRTSLRKLFQNPNITYLPLKDMEENTIYEINKIDRVDTKYGESIRCLLNKEYYIYLPKRFLIITKNQMDYLNTTPHILKKVKEVKGLYTLIVKKKKQYVFYNNLYDSTEEEEDDDDHVDEIENTF